MDQKTREGAVGISIAAAIVLLASFMPWGTVQARPSLPWNGSTFGDTPFDSMTVSMTLTGWQGNVTLLGVTIPNWFLVVLAAAIAAAVWLDAMNLWHPPKSLPFWLSAVGLAQAVGTLIVLLSGSRASLGIGLLVVTACFVAMMVTIRRSIRRARLEEGDQVESGALR